MHFPIGRSLALPLLVQLLAWAPACGADSAAQARPVLVRLGWAGDVLTRLYQDGVRLQAEGRYTEAESRFRSILSVDGKDWEAQERLVQVLQGQGRKSDRDARIEVLRKLHRSGMSWGPYFCRDVFVMGSKRVRALEHLERDEAGRKRILFLMTDLLEAGPAEAISIMRSPEIVRTLPTTALAANPKTIAGYELKVLGLERPRTYFIPYRKPEYSDMKNVLAEIVSGA